LAKIEDIGMPINIVTKLSNTALPRRKNSSSEIPHLMFHLMTMIRSTIGARDPTTIVKISAGRNLHVLMND
jgi:hypothetical protein